MAEVFLMFAGNEKRPPYLKNRIKMQKERAIFLSMVYNDRQGFCRNVNRLKCGV